MAKVTPEEFIRIWQTSKTRAEVARRTGYKAGSVTVMAVKFRKAGVPLKKFAHGVQAPDYAALADLARSLANAQEEQPPCSHSTPSRNSSSSPPEQTP